MSSRLDIGQPAIRRADPDRDGAACAAIYAPYVTNGAISFEEIPPDAGEMARRIGAARVWLVAEADGAVVGFAYGAAHRERAAYRWAADVSVYIEQGAHGRGIGRALYMELFEELRADGVWMACAGITQPNDASNALHASLGFTTVGTYRRIGWKGGRWHDVLWLQLDLHPEDPGPPR